jgi:glycosyltransferase involved in cell wall biosynthesis
MRIGILLRAWGEKGGVGVYTRNIVRELLDLDQKNQYVLFFREPSHPGSLGAYPRVTERVVRAPNKALWDQVAIPWACYRERVDVVFHPKFTVPLLAPCKAVMVVHGADWFIPEQAQFYRRLDVRYIKTVMPLYFRKAAVVLSVSHLTTDNFCRVLRFAGGKIRTVYFAPARHFRRVTNEAVLRDVRARYKLPERYVLTLTKVGGDTRKNFGQVVQAYARYHAQAERRVQAKQRSGNEAPHKLVVGGQDCDRLREPYGIPADGWGASVLFPGWIAQEDLPAVYSMASLYLYPSYLEAFPIPVLEAMACGTPVITSNVNGLQEIAGDAALLVDPGDPESMRDEICRVLSDPDLRATLSAKGLARSSRFTWDKCARETLSVLESLAP